MDCTDFINNQDLKQCPWQPAIVERRVGAVVVVYVYGPVSIHSGLNSLTLSIVEVCVRFSGCHESVIRAKSRVLYEEQLKYMATGLFNGVKMTTKTDDPGKTIIFLGALKIFRNNHNFMAGENSTDENKDGPTSD